MSFAGTFQTIELGELLGFLARGSKSGALRVDAGALSGMVALDGGRCAGACLGDGPSDASSEPALRARFVDVCFALAMPGDGSFRFETDEHVALGGPTVDVLDALEDLNALTAEWAVLRGVIPSLDAVPRLAPALPVDAVIVDASSWPYLVRVDGTRSVRQLTECAGGHVLDGARALRPLVEEGAVLFDESPEQYLPVRAPASGFADAPTITPSAPYGPGVDDLEDLVEAATAAPVTAEVLPGDDAFAALARLDWPEPGSTTADIDPALAALGDPAAVLAGDGAELAAAADDAPDRGALLRLFSALRDG